MARPDPTAQARLNEAYGKLPLSFEANQGQTDGQVKFLSRGRGHSLFLTSNEAIWTGPMANGPRPYAVLRMKLVGANTAPSVMGLDELPSKSNYFIGNDPQAWRTEVPHYAKVQYRNVYPGVDLIYHGSQRQLEYDFVVSAGADPKAIRLAFEGAESLRIDARGDLVLQIQGGEVRQHKPVVYQEVDGVKRIIPGRYVRQGKRQVGFRVAAYDRSKPLVIDPALSYSTFLGGRSYDYGNSIAVDSAGNTYITGYTGSVNFPTTASTVQPTFGGGFSDAFVLKLNPAGSALIYSTYLGGFSTDEGRGIAVDGAGNAYVTGYTESRNFPTLRPWQAALAGLSDAFVAKLNPAGSALIYSTYLGFTFTLGRGTELCVSAIRYLSRFVCGRHLSSLTDDMARFSRQLTRDSQFRWLGPEKGVIHLATAALVNAVWDLYARAENKPLWKLLADFEPEQIVAAIDFTYITDAITPEEGLALLKQRAPCKETRLQHLQQSGYPAYTTSTGWFGFSDDKIRDLCRQALDQGWTHFKLKVGGDPGHDLRRSRLVRQEIGPANKLMMDANQQWGVIEAIERTNALAEVDPWWMEEPTSPDDILGHARIRKEVSPVRIATGEHCHNRVMFKQLMQAEAIDVCQIDSCRLAGVNENLAVLLMAAKFDIPVCPHAGGIGLCECVQHLAIFDYLRVSTSLEGRVTEFVDHLHEHFVNPVRIRNGHYLLPQQPGYGTEICSETLSAYSYPDGPVWR